MNKVLFPQKIRELIREFGYSKVKVYPNPQLRIISIVINKVAGEFDIIKDPSKIGFNSIDFVNTLLSYSNLKRELISDAVDFEFYQSQVEDKNTLTLNILPKFIKLNKAL